MKKNSISPRKPSNNNSSIIDSARYQATNETTIAEFNKVSFKDNKHIYNPQTPFRIILPDYFNIPAFRDSALPLGNYKENKIMPTFFKEDAVFKKRMKDLSLLAEGMKRAKNIKEQSRYYFTQGVLLHNAGQYLKSIQYFEKFLKIVIYLQDSKSIQLALNVIGCAYMYLGEYQKALEFHNKQIQVSDRADLFISKVNTGMCYEMIGNAKEAFSRYQQAVQYCEYQEGQDADRRAKAINQLVQRVQNKIVTDQVFVTENGKSKSPAKDIRSNFIKQESSLIMKKVSNRKQYESAKLKYAITTAQENIEQHLKSSIQNQ